MTNTHPLTVMLFSSAFKGEELIRSIKAQGCRVLFMTEDKLRDEPWPYESIDETFYTPDLRRYQDVINTVTYLARERQIDHVLPIDEFEVELAATLREHMRLPGPRLSAVRNFRDKLVMRELASEAKIAVPPFTKILTYDALREYMRSVEPPWVLKPRKEASAMGIRKVTEEEQVWRSLDELGDRQSYYLLEKFIPGEVFHVDSLVVNSQIVYSSVQKYYKPPMTIYQGGGVFATSIQDEGSSDTRTLDKLNKQVIATLGMDNGVTHGEFIKGEDGTFYFLEMAGRAGGAFISDFLEHAHGINLWREWGNLEVAQLRGEKYKAPKTTKGYGGLIVTLARQPHPDLSAYNDPEVVWRADKPYHAGVIFVTKDYKRSQELLSDYALRFTQDFLAVANPMDATRTGYSG
ncbi:MAG: ATP-grasp domain-containing protein [Chloroflexi bacterium]|nr:ATP-grasp domain-containing protein [Chloroflexota bacterium]